MLIYQGWADAIVTPAMTTDYYEAVESKSGGREATQSYLRLFILPGVDHCGIQPGPGADRRRFDPLTRRCWSRLLRRWRLRYAVELTPVGGVEVQK
jgi:Tannase and feruloyl esterase